jgi:anti-sigma B factor antagonist
VNFDYNISNQPNVVVFAISGRISQVDMVEQIMIDLNSAIESANNFIIFDISKLEYINSSGLNFFIRALTRTRNAGKDLILSGMNGVVEKLFVISKLNEIFTICPTLEEGLKKVNAN